MFVIGIICGCVWMLSGLIPTIIIWRWAFNEYPEFDIIFVSMFGGVVVGIICVYFYLRDRKCLNN